jgi:hypothetical protein
LSKARYPIHYLLEFQMFEETLARLRTHHKNVQRYRQLLKTSLTDFEREYISRRLSEEQAAIEALSADEPIVTTSAAEATHQPSSPSPPSGLFSAISAISVAHSPGEGHARASGRTDCELK